MKAIFGSTSRVLPGGITILILWSWATSCMSMEVPDLNSRRVAAADKDGGVGLVFLFTAGLSGVVSSTISALSRLRERTSPKISKLGADIKLAKNTLQVENTLLTSRFHPWGVLSVLKYTTSIDCTLVVMM